MTLYARINGEVEVEGYLNPLYVQSFSEIGEPIFLPRSKGWLVKRQIPGTKYFDAMGPYPLFFCERWDQLPNDLEEIRDEILSFSFVIGPFEEFNFEDYKSYFDICRLYKKHYIYDTKIPLETSVNKYSQRDARRALRDVDIDLVVAPQINLDEWVNLYESLVKRHQVTGIRAFSRESFARQIAIPNTHFFRAWHNNELVAGNLYYIQNNVAYGHLLALTEKGYELGASHAIQWVALQHFRNEVSWVDFGGGTGSSQGNLSGLDKFKMGWSNKIGKSYFCAKILNRKRYAWLVQQSASADDGWFPAYRHGDF